MLGNFSGSFKISPYLQGKMCYVGQKEVFREGSDSIREFLGIEIDAKQIENVSHFWGEETGEEVQQNNIENLERSKGLHYVMVDGAFILSREPSWKEVKLGRIFKAKHLYSVGNEKNTRGWIRKSNYTAHLGNCEEFFEKFSPKIDLLEDFICLGDGAKWIWDWCTQNYPKARQLLDYWHGTQHLWKFAKLEFKTEKRQNSWMEKQETLLWEDGIEQVIQNIKEIEGRNKKSKEEKQSLVNYLTNNKTRMLYGTFKKEGWLVGSGPIESAHRTVIQKRLKQSGQRWTILGAQQILNLRVEYKNDNWQQVLDLIAS